VIEIDNSGERILLEKETPLMIARHFSAYQFAKEYIQDKEVLDIGCGEGYGSYFLAGYAKSVMALDYDKSIIAYASDKYKKDNLLFYALDAKDLRSVIKQFDAICSFQVIEHMPEPQIFLENIKGLLKNNGVFICSTPNKLDASPKSDIPLNKFHIKEYLFDEFKELLQRYFASLELFGLKRGMALRFYRRLKKIGLFNYFPGFINPVDRFYIRVDCSNFVIVESNIQSALDFIAVGKK